MTRRYRPARRRHGSRRAPSPVLLVTEDERGLLLAAAIRLIWLYRSELAPALTAGSLAVMATWAHARHPGWAIPLAGLAIASAAVLAARRPGWLAARMPFGRRAERLYAASVIAYGGLWLAAATAWGPGTPPLPTAALAGTLAAGVPWWAHRRRRARARVERTIEAWPQFCEAVGLPGSRILSATADRWGWTARLALRRGQTARQAVDHMPAIESALGARVGAVRIETDPRRADRALMRVTETDPHAEPIPWPGVPSSARSHAASVASPVELGVFEDGSPVLMRLLCRNTLIGGVVGSGKSGVLNVVLAALAACLDVVVWGIDLKGGIELRPWAACLGRLATTGADAAAMLADAVAELQRRTADLTACGQRLWLPEPDRPALLVVVDEYAELPESAHACADTLARLGRAAAVNLLAATQRPTQQAMGHRAVRSQMDNRVCLRVRERRDVDLVLGQGMHAAGWRAESLDAPGKFLISTPEHTAPRPARAYLIQDADVQAATSRCAKRQQTAAPAWPTAAPPDQIPGRSDRAEAAQEEGNPVNPETALSDALRDAPAEGVSIADLMAATGMSRRWVYYRLKQHAATGQATRTDRGRWKAAKPR
jgi:S-DNA-T family DNA segregation ATPase FtsK/SpoIIIE